MNRIQRLGLLMFITGQLVLTRMGAEANTPMVVISIVFASIGMALFLMED